MSNPTHDANIVQQHARKIFKMAIVDFSEEIKSKNLWSDIDMISRIYYRGFSDGMKYLIILAEKSKGEE